MTKRIYYNDKNISIYVDTNVIRNYCVGQKAEIECLKFLFEKRKRKKLFTSTLAIGQIISVIQKKKGMQDCLKDMYLFNDKMTAIDFSEKDMLKSYSETGCDIEDRMHYVLSKKKDCKIIITNDNRGFLTYTDVIVVKPNKLGTLRNLID